MKKTDPTPMDTRKCKSCGGENNSDLDKCTKCRTSIHGGSPTGKGNGKKSSGPELRKETPCIIDGCERPRVLGRKTCRAHIGMQPSAKGGTNPPCSVEGCENPTIGKGKYCNSHRPNRAYCKHPRCTRRCFGSDIYCEDHAAEHEVKEQEKVKMCAFAGCNNSADFPPYILCREHTAKPDKLETPPHDPPHNKECRGISACLDEIFKDTKIEPFNPPEIVPSWQGKLVDKFPTMDPSWPLDVQLAWFDSFKNLVLVVRLNY